VLVDQRDDVQRRMQELGIPTAVHYPRGLHQQPAYASLSGGASFPVCEDLARRVISLPFSADLNPAQLEEVVSALAKVTKRAA
jgi:UDP-2-acetamido-2-deoxy-ribo-hexuluronate aminotransferase